MLYSGMQHRQSFTYLCVLIIGTFLGIGLFLEFAYTPFQSCPKMINGKTNQSIEANLILSSGINVPLLRSIDLFVHRVVLVR